MPIYILAEAFPSHSQGSKIVPYHAYDRESDKSLCGLEGGTIFPVQGARLASEVFDNPRLTGLCCQRCAKSWATRKTREAEVAHCVDLAARAAHDADAAPNESARQVLIATATQYLHVAGLWMEGRLPLSKEANDVTA